MVFISLALVGCGESEQPESPPAPLTLSLINPVLQWQDDVLGIVSGIEFQPSEAVLDALNHGVAVTLVVATRIHPVHGVLASNDQTRNHRFEIRYLPLIEHYQLTELKTQTSVSYPRLRLLMAALAEPRFLDTHLNRRDISDRPWHVQAKADIDRERLPAPMQLSVFGDSAWQGAEDWQNWRVSIDGDQ